MPSEKDKPSKEQAGGVTIGEYLSFLLPRLTTTPKVPKWPPDVFALCMSLLLRSGAYCTVLTNWPPQDGKRTDVSEWVRETETIATKWRKGYPGEAPDEVRNLWEKVMSSLDVVVCQLGEKIPVCQALLELCAISDAACVEIGLPHEGPMDEPDFYNFGDTRLCTDPLGSTLCVEIDRTRIRVLPKMHTPQRGLTIRSLSLHLGLCVESELKPQWHMAPGLPSEGEGLNLLVIPWPPEIYPAQFRKTESLASEMLNMPEEFGFFTFQHKEEPDAALTAVKRLFEAAESQVGRIGGVVLPELALSPKSHERLSEYVLAQKAFLIAGVGEPSNPPDKHGTNKVCFDIPNMQSISQRKHHRWRLDSAQVQQYGLGSVLHPETKWWEHINLEDRQVNLIAMYPWLVMCPLICEDLARPDPIGEVVRAVGPNLVIALLMDGPQIKERWGAMYAGTLADDPGCSVLTLTSLGMASLSRPLRGGENRPRVVALWKDSESGVPTEIELPSAADGIVLSLSVRYLKEYTADGRDDESTAGCPILSGIYVVKTASQ